MIVHINSIKHAKVFAFDSHVKAELFDASPKPLVPIENKNEELKEQKIHQTWLILRKIDQLSTQKGCVLVCSNFVEKDNYKHLTIVDQDCLKTLQRNANHPH